MERKPNIISLEPGQIVMIVGVKKSLLDASYLEDPEQLMKEAVETTRGRWSDFASIIGGSKPDASQALASFMMGISGIARKLDGVGLLRDPEGRPQEQFVQAMVDALGSGSNGPDFGQRKAMASRVADIFCQTVIEEESPKK